MINTLTHWLVEIRLNEHQSSLPDGERIISFEEVLAYDESESRRAGFDQFSNRCKYEPVMRRKIISFGITAHNCYAADAIAINY